MNTLYIYADECGGIPLDDSSEPFVGAAVSAIQPITGALALRFDVPLLVRHLARTSAAPFLAHVKPFPGYGAQVSAKFDKMDTMARARKLVTGVHEYLPSGGVAVRNNIWVHCVTQAVGQALVMHSFRGPIDRVVVTFDQKTLAPESRRMVIDKCREIPQRITESAAKFHALNPRQVESVLSNVQVAPDDMVIQWSDEPGTTGTEDGLHLADRLAWHYQKHLQSPTQPSFLDALAQAGHKDITYDVTQIMIRPIDRDSIETWKRDTGLPEPAL